MENELISHYKEKGLIGDDIIFCIGLLELASEKDGEVRAASSLGAFERINAIGLNNGVLRAFYMELNHLKDTCFEFPLEEIKEFKVKKGFLGKVILSVLTETKYFEYKVHTNKNLAFKMLEKYNEYKENHNV